MKFKVLVFFLFLFESQFLAQEKVEEKKMQFIIRGKVLGFVLIEDLWARSGSVGAEVRFSNYWGIAADIVHFQWKREREVPVIPGDYSKYDEYAKRDQRNYVALETRFYPWKYSSDKAWKPYLNAFSKLGKRQIRTEDLYPYEKNEEVRLNSSLFDVGASVGFSYGKKFGIDFNLGVSKRFETKTVYTYVENNVFKFAQNKKTSAFSPNCRLTFFYKL